MKETRVEKKRRKRRLIIKILIFMLFIAAVITISLRSSFFQLNNIEITGNSKLNHEEILQASGLTLGDNLLLIGKGQVKRNIINLPYTKDVTVKRQWPKGVEINIEERIPYLQFENGYSFAIVDTEGIYLENSITKLPTIPLIKNIRWPKLKYGDSIVEVEETKKFADFFSSDEIVEITLKFKNLEVEDDNNIKIDLISGVLVEFGPLDNVKYKLRMLNEIILDIEKKKIPTRMIIMNKGEHPIVVRDDR